MSTAATVRNIAAPHNGLGMFTPERLCRIPEGAQVVEMKYCELCGRSFPRVFAPTEVTAVRKTRFHIMAGMGFTDERPAELRADKGERLCRQCHTSPTPQLRAEELLTLQERYKAQFPATENQMRHATHLPKYERSLPVGRRTSAHELTKCPAFAERRKRTNTECWRGCVTVAFAFGAQLTMEQLCDALPGCLTPQQAYQFCYDQKINLQLVRRENPSGFPGLGHGVYTLVPETVQ